MTPISTKLAEQLSGLADLRLVATADMAGVQIKTVRRAAAEQPIAAGDTFALCAALGLDPVDQAAKLPRRIGKLNPLTLALFLNTRMRVKKLTVRDVADSIKVSTRVVAAVCEGNPVNANNVVKVCRYLGIHPFDLCERVSEARAA